MDNEKVPEWAKARVVELINATSSQPNVRAIEVDWTDRYLSVPLAFARYIAEHEEPPVEPLEQAMADANAILKGEGNGTYQEVCDALRSLMHLLAAHNPTRRTAMQDNVTQAVDWDAPLEAYHRDGRVVAVNLEYGPDRDGDYFTKPKVDGEDSWLPDGRCWPGGNSPWRVRNRLASTAQPEVKALVEALEGALHFSDAVAYRDDALAVSLRQWLEECRTRLAAYHEAQP